MALLNAKQQQFWQENGYVVVADVVPQPLLAAVICTIEKFLGKSMDNPNDWYREPMYPGGIINMNQHQALWDTRQYPRVHAAFSDIWGTEKLQVSQDRTNMNPPTGPLWDHSGTIHWDMLSTERPISLKVQGVLCLSDTAADQGGFQCVPGFHRHLEAWAQSQPPDRPPRHPDTRGMDIRDVPAAAGDLIIWHSALPHGNSRNRTDRPRLCQYITMSPAAAAPLASGLPLVRTERAIIANALGVPEGLVEAWLRAQRNADRVLVRADGVEDYALIPQLIRLELGDQVRYMNRSWGRKIDAQTAEISREFAAIVDVPIDAAVMGSTEAIEAVVRQIPPPRYEPVLTPTQLMQLPDLLIAAGAATAGALWDESAVARLMAQEFGLVLDIQEAELTPLGRKLAGVDAW